MTTIQPYLYEHNHIMLKNINQPKETMFTRNAMIKGIAKATAKDKAKKTKAKKGVFFKNKKIAKNAEDLFTKILTQ